jgi:hypothetical protein
MVLAVVLDVPQTLLLEHSCFSNKENEMEEEA